MFFLLHWVKGSPVDDYDQGEYADKTWWEQMDQGRPWTTNKKFLMLVAVALYVGAVCVPRQPSRALHLCVCM